LALEKDVTVIEGIKADKSGWNAAFISLYHFDHCYALIIFLVEWIGGGVGALDSKTR
jgi:hypothetical protein